MPNEMLEKMGYTGKVESFNVSSPDGVKGYLTAMGAGNIKVETEFRQQLWMRVPVISAEFTTEGNKEIKLKLGPRNDSYLTLGALEINGKDSIAETQKAGFRGDVLITRELFVPRRTLKSPEERDYWLMKNAGSKGTIDNETGEVIITTMLPATEHSLAVLAHEFGHHISSFESVRTRHERSDEIFETKKEYLKLLDKFTAEVSLDPAVDVLKRLPQTFMDLAVNRLGMMQNTILDELMAWKHAETLSSFSDIVKSEKIQELRRYVMTERVYAVVPEWVSLFLYPYGAGTIISRFGEWVVENRDVWKQSLNDAKKGSELAQAISLVALQFSENLVLGLFEPFVDLESVKNEFTARLLLLRNFLAGGAQAAKGVNVMV